LFEFLLSYDLNSEKEETVEVHTLNLTEKL